MPDTTVEIVHALYSAFFERGVRYFFPDAALAVEGRLVTPSPTLRFHSRPDGSVDLDWMGSRYHFETEGRPFTENQMRLLAGIGAVLSARYRSIFSAASAASTTSVFQGLAEDRYVSAFLDHTPYLDEDGLPAERDVVADAIEVLRESSLLTYENRRISTGVILLGAGEDPFHPAPAPPPGALRYTNLLIGFKTFYRLCDGLRTVFLVDRDGMLVDLVDMQQFARGRRADALPAPSAARYHAHTLATLHGGHLCLVLTPNGEIKIFAGGVQMFHFMEGRWRLSDIPEKYHEYYRAVGQADLARRLFTAALNLAERRRGGLFVMLDDPRKAADLIVSGDLLAGDTAGSHKGHLHYLLRNRRVEDLELTVLESIAHVDGAVVMDREGHLLAFGAILRHVEEGLPAQEGGRTTAALHASRFGPVLKISEDGGVSFYQKGIRVWEI
ncbi:MAG TPA: hypothetical protein VE959_28270 [Bryobacteraceae bacterium]|nr:hypothetical protein [Bryobacteraceae bacterium]